MSEKYRNLPPNPVLPIEQMAGSEMSEPFAWLSGHLVDSLVIADRHLVSVDHRYEGHDGAVHVLCTDSDGSTHMFEYDPTDHTEPVRHVMWGDEKAD
jgi:hypothetical protein